MRGGAAALALAAAASSLGCGGTDVGNGAAAISVDVQAFTSTAPINAVAMPDGTVIDSAWMALGDLRVQPGTTCDESDGRIDVSGPFVSDLIGVGVLGGAPQFFTESGFYCEFRTTLRKLAPDEAPTGTGLADLSIVLTGTRPGGDPFVVESALGSTLELKSQTGGFAVVDGDNPLFLAFDLREWMEALDLGSLPPGPVAVNADNNQSRLDAFEQAVEDGARLLADSDGNGHIEDAEHQPGSELAD